ncbi:MAG: hypothetical protein M1834_007873 [Cirrosporium novae-zelandiae]|nr:MAG: hypothetical protein M1834_007873 [Cirrosporium novae-zelandiae]
MLSSLLRTRRGRRQIEHSPFSSINIRERQRLLPHHNDYNSGDEDDEDDEDDGDFEEDDEDEDEDNEIMEEDEEEESFHEEGEDGYNENSPLLPIFSSAQLDSLPVYSLTHTIRLLVISRCETTLSWDQLRSPQVSQFLVKPIQQQILSSHFSKATVYVLMANCLQFYKETQTNPGNSGVSTTRALVCELIAIRLLREYSTRELIDALSYDFDPLQGMAVPSTGSTPPTYLDKNQKVKPRVARIPCLEISIKAQAKRFLAHPLVVKQLEAIWAGTIVFHSAADNLHRVPRGPPQDPHHHGHGPTITGFSDTHPSSSRQHPTNQRNHDLPFHNSRRSVTLYDPRDASLFKLSRLRVPRYRHFLSTCSYAILLALFVAVLFEKSEEITTLEMIFWFWSAGFMLDEIVGFNEQGFSLYMLSFWNIFDVGILMLFITFYCLRIYGVMTDNSGMDIAYDILAANAVLLFPRLFSILDHYRYFSQLLIAFRMMAQDLARIMVLIGVTCSGFFVAFTLSFGERDYDASGVAYALFQILMGFTPAAWEQWPHYNLLGKAIMTMFLIICHFVVVTILITVLTNSFMMIVQNANEEHQFLFAVNTISMVKSDALFSYVAPTNILAWFLTPLRYVLPFRQFIRLNRNVIKVTHFPILFGIYLYEITILRMSSYEASDLVGSRGRSSVKPQNQGHNLGQPHHGLSLFSPQPHRLREPSIATYHKDRALEEVFKRPMKGPLHDTQQSKERRQNSTVVNWIQGMGPAGVASPPIEQDRAVVDQLESGRPLPGRTALLRRRRLTDLATEATRSIASDPEDFLTRNSRRPFHIRQDSDMFTTNVEKAQQQPDEEADDAGDELVTNDEEEEVQEYLTSDQEESEVGKTEDYFGDTPIANNYLARPASPSQSIVPPLQTRNQSSAPPVALNPRPHAHNRNYSTNTILFNPQRHSYSPKSKGSSPTSPPLITAMSSTRASTKKSKSGAATPIQVPLTMNIETGRRTPRRPGTASASRPHTRARSEFQSAPNLAGLLDRRNRDRVASGFMDLASDIGDNKAVGGAYMGAVPSSFQTQMAFLDRQMRSGIRNQDLRFDDQEERSVSNSNGDHSMMMARLMLARMKTLEEGFKVVLDEVREMRRDESRSTKSAGTSGMEKGEKENKSPRKGRSVISKGKEPRKERSNTKKQRGSSVPQTSYDEMEGIDTQDWEK